MRSELRSLINNASHFVKRKIGFVAVFGGPTALAVVIAGACRVKKNNKRNVAFVFFSVFSDGFRAVDSGAKAESEKHFFDNSRVTFVNDIHCEFIPDIFGILNCFAESVKILFGKCSAHELLREINQLNEVFGRIFFDILKYSVESNRS